MANSLFLPDGSFDWSNGVDSSKVTTLKSDLNVQGLPRNQLAWMYNSTVRGGGILQRLGWQPLMKLLASGHWQGGYMYQPDGANPYLVCSISGHIYKVLVEPPYSVTELFNTIVAPWTNFGPNVGLTIDGIVIPLLDNPEFNPDTERAYFCQGENILVIQAGDYFNNSAKPTLPLFWDGTTLRRSIGITSAAPSGYLPNINEIPAATAMDYYNGQFWYANARQISAGDQVGGPSGNLANRFRDAIISVTENPLVLGGDGFTMPTNGGNIRAIKHSANMNATLGEGSLFIFTRSTIYSLSVPQTRTDWISTTATNQPRLTVVQKVNGSVNDISVVHVNGDLFYQSLEPAVRSLQISVRNFGQWGNTPISQNEQRALQVNNRGLMRFSSGIEFDNRMLQLVLPKLTAEGMNVVHQAILPLDFDVVSNLNTGTGAEGMTPTVWEGAYDGLQHLQLFEADFGGLHRAFSVAMSDLDGSINVWELTTSSRTENGDNRVLWGFETAAYTWSTTGLEVKFKHLKGGECWIDKVFGTVEMDVYYRVDADPCWRLWFHHSICSARDCEEVEPVCIYPYPGETFREGYKFSVVFPEPQAACDSMGVRPSTIGYQFQVKIILKGWCRVRGLVLYAMEHTEPQYHGVACPATGGPKGMFRLPHVPTPLP